MMRVHGTSAPGWTISGAAVRWTFSNRAPFGLFRAESAAIGTDSRKDGALSWESTAEPRAGNSLAAVSCTLVALGTARGSVESARVGVRRPVALEPPLARRRPARAGPHPRLAPRGPCSRTAARAAGRLREPGRGPRGRGGHRKDGPAGWERIYVIRRRRTRPELATVRPGSIPTTTEVGETGKRIIPGHGQDEARPRPQNPHSRNMDPVPPDCQ